MAPSDAFTTGMAVFYLALSVILLGIVLLTLPTLIDRKRHDRRRRRDWERN